MRVKRLVGQAVAWVNYESRPGSGGPTRARSFARHRYARPRCQLDLAAALRGES